MLCIQIPYSEYYYTDWFVFKFVPKRINLMNPDGSVTKEKTKYKFKIYFEKPIDR